MEFGLEKQYDSAYVRFDNTEEFKKLETMLLNAETDADRLVLNQLMEGMEAKYNNERDREIKAKMKDIYAELGKLEETITPVRKGFILDFSAGTIVKYDDYKINSSSLTNSSVWLTFGFDGLKTDTSDNSYFSILALSRLIVNNADELYKSGSDKRYTSWDNGVRLAFNTTNQKFTISGEIVSRHLFNTQTGNSSVSKYIVSAELQVGKNQRLSFSYGKDFENHITKDGNVIGLLNFVTGFFNKKTITGNQ